VFAELGEKVRGKHCDGSAGIIEEGKPIMQEDFDQTAMDACLFINQTAASKAHPPEGEDTFKTAGAKKPAARAAGRR
jgi:hypothetical protein